MIDVIVLCVCAVLSGGEGWSDIEEFGRTKLEWPRRYGPLANGVPVDDTIARVISALSVSGFQECFLSPPFFTPKQFFQVLPEIAMKPVASHKKDHKPTSSTLSSISLLTAWLVFGFGFSSVLQAIDLGDNPISSLSRAHLAVWQIQDFRPDTTAKRNPDDVNGTAFAISPDLFITNFHVLDDLFYLENIPLSDIYLVQKNNPASLKIKAVHIVSGVYDLALFQTTTSVSDYLAPAKTDFTLKRGDDLTLIGYPESSQGTFVIIKPKMIEGGMIYYEDDIHYGFGSDVSNLKDNSGGASGGPVLNSEGKVIAIYSSAHANMAYGTKIQHLQDLIKYRKSHEDPSQSKRTFCPQPSSPYPCLRKEKSNVRKLAEQLDFLALYQMGIENSYINELESDWTVSKDRLRLSAQLGFPLAQFSQGWLHYNAETQTREERRTQDRLAFDYFQEASDMGDASSQYALAIMYLNGLGTTRNNRLARYWATQAIIRGYAPAEDLIHTIP